MLLSVLKSDRAIALNIQIMRLFAKMRQVMATYKGLPEKIEKLEVSNLQQQAHPGYPYAHPGIARSSC
jgi:hypothetical protein